MRSASSIFLLGSLAVTGIATQAHAQSAPETPTFHADAELVLVDVTVIDKKTRTAIPELNHDQIQIFEDGAAQPIRSFSRDETPLSVVLLLDLTASSRPVLAHFAKTANQALNHLKPQDEVAVITYAARIFVVDGFTTDRSRTEAAIRRAPRSPVGGGALFNEAVYQASAQLRQSAAPVNRRVIVWFTDNMANAGDKKAHTEADALRILHEEGITVAPLLLKSWMSKLIAPGIEIQAATHRNNSPGDANKYAELSGGMVIKTNTDNAEARLAEMIDHLRSRYTIGYRPSETKPAGTFYRIRVSLTPGTALRTTDWTVLAPAGYYRK
jgi:VWFA-related protein